jgi:ATP-dependent DNA ligase
MVQGVRPRLRTGFEVVVSKRRDNRYVSGRSKACVKVNIRMLLVSGSEVLIGRGRCGPPDPANKLFRLSRVMRRCREGDRIVISRRHPWRVCDESSTVAI